MLLRPIGLSILPPRQVLDIREALVMEQFLPGNPYWCETSDRLFNQPELRCFRGRLPPETFGRGQG
jgi:hypothetical protein